MEAESIFDNSIPQLVVQQAHLQRTKWISCSQNDFHIACSRQDTEPYILAGFQSCGGTLLRNSKPTKVRDDE